MKIDLRRKRDLGKILDDSFALYRAHWRTLLWLSFVVVVPVYLLVFGVGLGYLWSGYDAAPSGNEVRLSDVADTFVGLGAQLFVVTPLVTAMTVHVVRTAAEERRASASESMRVGFDVFPQMLLAILLVGAGVALGLIALIIPGLILAVRWVVVSQVVVVEGQRGTAALRRSFELTRDRGWHAFLVLFVLNILVGVLSAVVLVPLDYAAEQADTMALTMVSQMLSSVLSLPLVALAYTLLYYSLVADKEGVAPAVPAAPAEAAAHELPGVPGTFGDGWVPPRPPAS